MDIGIVGLGLIGGSLAKTIKSKTNHTVGAFDTSQDVITAAIQDKSIDFYSQSFNSFDIILVSLFPDETVEFLASHVHNFKKGCIVIDCCGVKEYVCSKAEDIFIESGSFFIGGHPMAGREVGGYISSLNNLFTGSSMILTPLSTLPEEVLSFAKEFFLSLGFGSITVTTPKHHDTVIAYTSQLAHVVSSAYMQSDTAQEFMGFSAGSFADLTRVAKLDPILWSELFLKNKKPLTQEIDTLINNLKIYRDFIADDNSKNLIEILKKGNDIKISLTNQRNGGK